MKKFQRALVCFLLLTAQLVFLSSTAYAEPQQDATEQQASLTEQTETSATEDDTEDTAAADSEDSDTADTESEDTGEETTTYSVENGFSPIDDFSIEGTAALLYDLNSDTMLYTQNPDEKVYPASLAKVLTCLVALENGNLDDDVTVSATALQNIDIGGSTAELQAGEVMKLEDLLYCVMLASANEACNVVAEHIAGSIDKFVEMLNACAEELGCTNSHFANTNGLHDEEEYTTVRDLMYITRAALQNETFCEIAFSTTHDIPATNLHEARTLYTTNYLVSRDLSYKYYYANAAGVKTGYTSKAGRCLITTANSDGLYLLSIVTGCETTDEGNGEYYMHSFPESHRMLEYGLSNFIHMTALSPLVPVGEVPVNGSTNGAVVVPVEAVDVTLPDSYESSDITTEIHVNGGSLQAPVNAGDIVGTAEVCYRGVQIASVDITVLQSISTQDLQPQSTQDTEETASQPQVHIGGGTILIILCGFALLGYLVHYVRRKRARRKPANRRYTQKSAGKKPQSRTRRRK